MILTVQEIHRLTNTTEVSKLFSVIEERDFLSQYLSLNEIEECVSAGSTNGERFDMLILKMMQFPNRNFYMAFVDYFMSKCQQYKKMYFSLKYGNIDYVRDSSSQTNYDHCKLSPYDSFNSYETFQIVKQECKEVSSTPFNSPNEYYLSENPVVSQYLLKRDEEIVMECSSSNLFEIQEIPFPFNSVLNREEFIQEIPGSANSPISEFCNAESIDMTMNEPSSSGDTKSATKKKRICEVCGKELWRQHLKQHMLIHTGEKPFTCETCGKMFKQIRQLNEHTRVHTGEKPFACKICDQKFRHVYSLNVHMNVHTGITPYSCKLCDKKFVQISHFNEHMRIHTGEKPFVCEACGRRFRQSGALRQHARRHLGNTPFICQKCNKGFKDKDDLERHLKVHLEEIAIRGQ